MEKATETEPAGTCEHPGWGCKEDGQKGYQSTRLRGEAQAKNLGRAQEGPLRSHEGPMGGEKSQRKENALDTVFTFLRLAVSPQERGESAQDLLKAG